MKKLVSLITVFFLFTLTGCLTTDNYFYPAPADTVTIKVTKGTITLSAQDIEKNLRSPRAKQNLDDYSNMQYAKKIPDSYLSAGDTFEYELQGNHLVIFTASSSMEEAEFTVTYGSSEKTYTTGSADKFGTSFTLKNY